MEDLSEYEQELRQIDHQLSHQYDSSKAWLAHVKAAMNAARIYLARDRKTLRIDHYIALQFLEKQGYNCFAEGTRLTCHPDHSSTAVPIVRNDGGVDRVYWYSYEYLRRFDDAVAYLRIFDMEVRNARGSE